MAARLLFCLRACSHYYIRSHEDVNTLHTVMKRIVYNMLCMVLLGLLASCVDQQFESIVLKEVKATICGFEHEPENAARISYSLGESGYEAKWADGDVLGIYPVGGDQVAFPISDGTGASDAVFDGGAWALKSSYAYAAYYPFSAGNYTIPENQIPVTYAGQTQTGNNTFTHFSTYDYLASKATHPDSEGNVSLKMKHMGCFFLLKLTMPKAGTYTKVTLTSDNKEFTVQGTLDLTTEVPSITSKSTAKTISINLKDVTLEKDNDLLTVNLMMAPKDLSGSNITIKVTDSKGNTYATESDQQITGKEYLANKIYSFTRTMVESETPPTEQGHVTEPYFSETVELMGLIWRLAGASEYNQCQVSTVSNSANTYFASMRNHQAVTLAKQYYQQDVCYDAVTGYANQLIFDEEGKIIFDLDYLAGSNTSFDRWTNQQKNDMLVAVNDFYETSNFHDWFVSTQSEQQQAIASFKSVCNLDYTWFDSYYGKNDKLSSRIILSFMIGNSNNGISLKRKDGTLLLTPVLGSLSQNNGSVRFNGDMNLIVHEFSHPYCNPLIEANWSSISSKAEEVYSKVSSIMQNQAYSNAMTMMCETLVRSSAIRYMISHNQQNMVNMTLAYEEGNGFMMVRTLVKVLEEREQEAAKYPTLADFMPVLIEAINNFDPNDSSNQGGTAEPDQLPKDYVDLGLEMSDGKKLYFATRNVGETSPGGIGTYFYKWGATVEGGSAWAPEITYNGWPAGHKLDAAHDIATIKWGGDWHTPSIEEWDLLAEMCDYERKEADEPGYGVAGYFFYSKSDRSKFIFLPIRPGNNGLNYWSSEIYGQYNGSCVARYFSSYDDKAGCFGSAGIENTFLAIRPVIASAGTFDANGHEYVDLGIQTSDGKKLYFATMNVGETSPAGFGSNIYRWGATTENGDAWAPESYTGASGWPTGHKLDAAHDIATITWGEKWHIPSVEEWNLLVANCDYERKEADQSGCGVAGYFFYNKSDRSKFIFLPVSTWSGELEYWSSEICVSSSAYTFTGYNGEIGCLGTAGIESSGFAIRPVFVE